MPIGQIQIKKPNEKLGSAYSRSEDEGGRFCLGNRSLGEIFHSSLRILIQTNPANGTERGEQSK